MFTTASIFGLVCDRHASLCLDVWKSSKAAFIDSNVIDFAYAVCFMKYWSFFIVDVFTLANKKGENSVGLDSNVSGIRSFSF